MDKFLFVGADGSTGSIIVNKIRSLVASGHWQLKITAPTISDLDYRNSEQIKVYLVDQPDAIFLVGAYTNVDKAEHEDKKLCWEINRDGIENFLTTMLELQNKTVYKKIPKIFFISTDMVGSGEKPLCEDDDVWNTPQAKNEYGKSKLAGETVLRDLHKNNPENFSYHIIRIATPFAGLRARSFLTLLYNTIRLGKPVQLIIDQYVSPTMAEDLAYNLLAIYAHGNQEIYHDAIYDKKRWSVYDIGMEFAKQCGWNTNLIEKMTIADMYNFGYWHAPRGISNELQLKNIFDLPNTHICTMQEALKKFKQEYINLK